VHGDAAALDFYWSAPERSIFEVEMAAKVGYSFFTAPLPSGIDIFR
jgi:hypothetical protein